MEQRDRLLERREAKWKRVYMSGGGWGEGGGNEKAAEGRKRGTHAELWKERASPTTRAGERGSEKETERRQSNARGKGRGRRRGWGGEGERRGEEETRAVKMNR